jgi:hypothetical protein
VYSKKFGTSAPSVRPERQLCQQCPTLCHAEPCRELCSAHGRRQHAANRRIGQQSAPLTPSCTTPKVDPWTPDGGFLINDGASETLSPDVTLTIFASGEVFPRTYEGDVLDEIMEPPSSSATAVTEMRISNSGNMAGAAFEPCTTSKSWTLGQMTGLAIVYMQFRDAAGNVSEIKPNGIFVGQEPPPPAQLELALPFVSTP